MSSTSSSKPPNAVLFAAGSCWEGVDFPGDMVSSLIIVRLPFPVPDPISEAEREQYPTLQDYIREVIIPDMQVKLRQGFGRAIRTETDTCVVSILDYRAAPRRTVSPGLCWKPCLPFVSPEKLKMWKHSSGQRKARIILCHKRRLP